MGFSGFPSATFPLSASDILLLEQGGTTKQLAALDLLENETVEFITSAGGDGISVKHVSGLLLQYLPFLTLPFAAATHCRETWTFQEPFVDTSYGVSVSMRGPSNSTPPSSFSTDANPSTEEISHVGVGTITASSIDISVHAASGSSFVSGDQMYARAMAIGRWK